MRLSGTYLSVLILNCSLSSLYNVSEVDNVQKKSTNSPAHQIFTISIPYSNTLSKNTFSGRALKSDHHITHIKFLNSLFNCFITMDILGNSSYQPIEENHKMSVLDSFLQYSHNFLRSLRYCKYTTSGLSLSISVSIYWGNQVSIFMSVSLTH